MTKSIKLKDKDGIVYPYPFYPIGSIYLSIIDINPSTFFGGKWEQIAKGRTLVGVDTSQSEFNSVKKTGGAKSHTLTTNEMPSHNHIMPSELRHQSSGSWWIGGAGGTTIEVGNFPTNATGGGQAHNNLQPYFTCYIWLKISN